MTTPNEPEVIRGLAALTGPAAGAEAGASEEMSWEGLLQFFERFEGHLSRIVGIIQNVQKSGGQGQGKPQLQGGHHQAEAPALKKISSLKVYQMALGELANLSEKFPDMTLGQALEMMRNNKSVALAMLESKITELQSD